MGVTTIEGPMGAGKTLTCTMLICEAWKKSLTDIDPATGDWQYPEGRPIYTTYDLINLPHNKFDLPKMAAMIKQVQDMIEVVGRDDMVEDPFDGALIGLDESYLFFDNRRSASKGNLLFNALLARTRKLEADIFINVLSINDIDKRIRRFVTTRIKPKTSEASPWVRLFMKDMRSGAMTRARFYGPNYYDEYRTGERVALPNRLLVLPEVDG